MNSSPDQKGKKETAILGGGCFWCLEPIYSHTKGVISVMPGYAGGEKADPTYEEVSSGQTGHAEVAKVEFDPEIISYEELLRIFFSIHDPTTLNRQGNDVGTQYRSIILHSDDEQRKSAEKIKDEIGKKKIFDAPIITEIKPLGNFYPAEDYHREFFEKNPNHPYCQIIIAPKVAKFRERFKNYYI